MKKKTKSVLFGIAFLLVLLLPGLLYIPLGQYADSENYEKRALQEKPVFTLSAWADYPALFDAYFSDHLFFRNEIIQSVRCLDLRLFGEVDSDAVLTGQDGWLFYRARNDDEDSLADYRHTNLLTQDELAALSASLAGARERLLAAGTELIICIAPNKEQVYAEYMPARISVEDGPSNARQVADALSAAADAKIFYPLEVFQEAKERWCQIYRKYDTHWNDVGGYLCAELVMAAIEDREFSLEESMAREVVNYGTCSGDLAELLNLQNVLNDDAFLSVGGYHEDVTAVTVRADESESRIRIESDAPGGETLLLVRDSFGSAMSGCLAKRYAVLELADYRTADCAAVVSEVKPDVVVVEMAERYIGSCLQEVLDQLGS